MNIENLLKKMLQDTTDPREIDNLNKILNEKEFLKEANEVFQGAESIEDIESILSQMEVMMKAEEANKPSDKDSSK